MDDLNVDIGMSRLGFSVVASSSGLVGVMVTVCIQFGCTLGDLRISLQQLLSALTVSAWCPLLAYPRYGFYYKLSRIRGTIEGCVCAFSPQGTADSGT